MQDNFIHILCTRPLPETLVETAAQAGIKIDISPFIETESILTEQVQQEIEQVSLQSVPVVFTSMNAVDAIAVFLDGRQPDWEIYSIGTATGRLVKEYFGEARMAGTANDAASLAGVIAKAANIDEVVFFCGDQRREELPGILKEHEIEVNEIVVYQTVALPHKLEKHYHGILFFSPSAVQSFFQKNKSLPDSILFAIGNTTATEIKKFASNKVVTSDEPGKENLVYKMIEYFS